MEASSSMDLTLFQALYCKITKLVTIKVIHTAKAEVDTARQWPPRLLPRRPVPSFVILEGEEGGLLGHRLSTVILCQTTWENIRYGCC
jgi:formate dehydrogenase maturation protein FdhE